MWKMQGSTSIVTPVNSGSGRKLRIGCALMAAGQAVRFGTNKLLVDWRGRPVYAHMLSALPADLLTRIVVVSGTPEILLAAADRGFDVVYNDRPQDGPGRTIRLGLERLTDMDACLFSVCDQPELQPHSLRQLVLSYTGGIRALAFDGQRGNPVIFPAELFDALRCLPDGKSGGAVLRRHPEMLQLSECGCRRELLDMDTPQDLAALKNLQHLVLAGPGAAELLGEALSMLPRNLACSLRSHASVPAALRSELPARDLRQLVSAPETLLLWSQDTAAAAVCDRLRQIAAGSVQLQQTVVCTSGERGINRSVLPGQTESGETGRSLVRRAPGAGSRQTAEGSGK